MQLAGFISQEASASDVTNGALREDARSFYERLFAARGALLSRDPAEHSSVQTTSDPEHASASYFRASRASDRSTTAAASADGDMQAASVQTPHQQSDDPRGACDIDHRTVADPKKAAFCVEPSSSSDVGGGAASTTTAKPTSPEHLPPQPPANAGPMPLYGIPRANIGFQLLQKAGWKEGTGLGRDEQGLQMPLEKSSQIGRQGLGNSTAKHYVSKQRQQEQQQQQQGVSAKDKSRRQQQLDELLEHKAEVARVALPENSEKSDDKIRRQRQKQKVEAEAATAKAISRYINMAFRDDDGTSSADDNPLKRRNRLTATNPLL